MSSIAIIGTGIAGLHLGLHLLQRGLRPTIYAELAPEQMRARRLPNTVSLYASARDTMRKLGVAHWDVTQSDLHVFELGVKGAPQIGFRAAIDPPQQFIDMRVYLPRLLEDFIERGGQVIQAGTLDASGVSEISSSHDLVVVASGRGDLSAMFPRDDDRSPFRQPQRRLFAGLFGGVDFPNPFQFTLQIVPGQGEIAEFELLSFEGPVTGFLVEAIPGGDLEPITRISYDPDDPRAFDHAFFQFLREHAPRIVDRIPDPDAFGCLGPLDHLQGAVTPVVRHGIAALPSGRFALGLGDAHITHDPILAQGANAAVRASCLLGELISEHARHARLFDRSFCTGAERHMRESLSAMTEWSNATLRPPPPHFMDLMIAASQYPAVAHEFVNNYDRPERGWSLIRDPKCTAEFIGRHRLAADDARAS